MVMNTDKSLGDELVKLIKHLENKLFELPPELLTRLQELEKIRILKK
jgi:hypothetical protein